ncbi:MAG TPA: hypothetical protein VJ725_30420 [Thermoanaerobaculia bacterium]|nr:hypothetical protein [Thermoanaerobaculia bacterium]
MKSKRMILAALVIALTCLAIVVPLFTPAVAACPAFGIHRYYSNAAHTTQVGQMTVYCNCSITMTGTKTIYIVYTPFDCSGGGIDP